MASTNKTTNYQLSQFLGGDKPAWLSDYNTDMNKIDTAIKNADDAAVAAGGTADAATTAIGTLSNLTTEAKTNVVAAINEVDANVDTAQTTANTANTTAAGCRLDLNKFNLTNRNNLTPSINLGVIETGVSLLQFASDTTNSIFKVYGRVRITNLSGISGTLTLKLGETSLRPLSAYYINSGATIYVSNTAGNYTAIGSRNIKVDTDGSIYVVNETSNTLTPINGSQQAVDVFLPPCLYFNSNFGDQ